MATIVLHDLTSAHVRHYIQQPAHALLIVGPTGIGKQFLAQHLAKELIKGDVGTYAYIKFIEPEKDKSSIGIEAIRELQHFLKLKLPTNAPWRIIVIPQAQGLTTEAQNALLKSLEEPPERTLFILASNSEQALLPTIRSRSQQLTVHIPTQQTLLDQFKDDGHEAKELQQAYMMSGGLPGLMSSLLSDQDHPLKGAVATARKLLQSTQFERLTLVDGLSKDKPAALNVIFVLQHMARAATTASAKVSDGSAHQRIKQWHKIHRAAYQAEQSYAVSGQAKLTLTNMMLSL